MNANRTALTLILGWFGVIVFALWKDSKNPNSVNYKDTYYGNKLKDAQKRLDFLEGYLKQHPEQRIYFGKEYQQLRDSMPFYRDSAEYYKQQYNERYNPPLGI